MASSALGDYLNASWLSPETPALYDWYDEYPYDLSMWTTICEESGEPVLDVGTGTGRVAIQLARAGLTVQGVDLSPAMVARAEKKLTAEAEVVQRRVCFQVGDMATFRLGRQFHTVIIPCFSFHELTSFEAQAACLTTMSEHLAPRGRLVIALGLLEPAERRCEPDEPVEWGKPLEEGINPHTGLLTRMWSLGWGDPSIQMRYHRFYFEEYDGDHLLRRFSVPEVGQWHARRFVGRYEMQLLLEDCGLAVDTIYGDWDMSPYTAQSKCMVFVAQKGRRCQACCSGPEQ